MWAEKQAERKARVLSGRPRRPAASSGRALPSPLAGLPGVLAQVPLPAQPIRCPRRAARRDLWARHREPAKPEAVRRGRKGS